jgi:sporulation protein YunB
MATCLILILTIVLAFILQKQIAPFVDYIAVAQARNMVNQIINETIMETLQRENIVYTDLFIIERDDRGSVRSASSNVIVMNNLKANIHNEMNRRIMNLQNEEMGVHIGSLIGADALANRGPKIPVRLVFNGSIVMDFRNQFTAAGINQTKHTSALETRAEVMVVLAGRQVVCSVESTIPVAETIILGEVPRVYLSGEFLR